MNYEINRLSTFIKWPPSAKQSAIRLAAAGFYYNGAGDEAVCFKCDDVIGSWNSEDDVRGRHRHSSPNCPLLMNMDAENVPLLHLDDDTFTKYLRMLPVTGNDLVQGQTQTDHMLPTDETVGATQTERPSPDFLRLCQIIINRGRSRGLMKDGNCYVTIDPNNPDFEQLRHEDVRLGTFTNWPPRAHVRPDDLARAGFFYTGTDDRVRCAFCRDHLRDWVPGDIPAEEHRKHFPDCPFVRNVDVGNVLKETTRKASLGETAANANPQSQISV